MTDENAGYQKAESGKPLALEPRPEAEDGRRFSPSTARNRDVLRDTFLLQVGKIGRVLEIASGTGEHGAFITAAAPELTWTYSDIDPASLDSQRAWAAHEGHDRLLGPYTLDASQTDWGEVEAAAPYEAVISVNMIHIAPIAACAGLIAGAGRLLTPDGKLFLYGPFARNGEIAPSNARFSADLKRRDTSWGVRDLEADILPLAKAAGLTLASVTEMPTNNLSVVFLRA